MPDFQWHWDPQGWGGSPVALKYKFVGPETYTKNVAPLHELRGGGLPGPDYVKTVKQTQ